MRSRPRGRPERPRSRGRQQYASRHARVHAAARRFFAAGIAALAALIINAADLQYVTMPALGASTGEYVAATFGAPVVEETMKGLVLVGLLWRRRDELDGPTDGVT